MSTIFLELGNLREQQQGIQIQDGESILLLDWSTYVKKYRKQKLKPVLEKKGTKALPVKSVLVKGKNPYIRTKQHYRPEQNLAQRHKGIDAVIDTLNKGGEIDHKKLNALINTHESNNTTQMHDLFTAIAGTAINEEYLQKGSAIGKVFRGLDIDRKIAGTSVAGYLTNALANFDTPLSVKNNILNFTSMSVAKVDKRSSNADKNMALYRTRQKSQFVDIHDREKFIDQELSTFVDQDFTEHSIKQTLFNKLGNNKSKDSDIERSLALNRDKVDVGFLSTILDHTLEKYGSANVSKVFKKVSKSHSPSLQKAVQKYMTGDGAENDSQSAAWLLLGASKNPKLMSAFMDSSKISPISLHKSDKQRLTALMEGWTRGSGHGIGSLLRKSAMSVMGGNIKDDIGHLPNKNSLYPGKSLSSDKIPDNFLKSMKQLNVLSKEFISTKDVDSDLHRGVFFHDVGDEDITFKSMISSASSDAIVSGTFAGDAEIRKAKNRRRYPDSKLDRLTKNEQLRIPSTMSKYVKNVDAYSRVGGKDKGFLLTYDKQKLAKDNKIFAVLSFASFAFMKDKYGIVTPNITKEYGDEQEYLLAI